ncbi:UNVERIFIED_CONTAM: hypothetical protein K2H54_055025 [Gekko kuhli]
MMFLTTAMWLQTKNYIVCHGIGRSPLPLVVHAWKLCLWKSETVWKVLLYVLWGIAKAEWSRNPYWDFYTYKGASRMGQLDLFLQIRTYDCTPSCSCYADIAPDLQDVVPN